jgi:regulatory protein
LLERREDAGGVTLVIGRADEHETYELARDAVPAELPEVGGSVDSPLLARIRHAAERKRVARRIFALLDRKLRSRADLRRRLADEGFAPDVVTAVLDAFADSGLHSDRSFATAYCRDALGRKAVGRYYLAAQLRRRGVAASDIDAALADELPPDRERELVWRAAATRWRRERKGRSRASEARVARFLASRGFPTGLCREAARDTGPGLDDDEGEAT